MHDFAQYHAIVMRVSLRLRICTLPVLVALGCRMPEYETFLEQQKMWESTGSDSSGTLDVPDPGSGTSARETVADTTTSADVETTDTGPQPGTSGGDMTTDAGEAGTSGDETTSGPTPFCGDGEVNTPFEECDVGTPDPDGPCSPSCQRARVIFVLSLSVKGKLGGLQGADAYCRSQAVKAKMADPSSPIVDPANFKALLPSSQETVFERHFRGKGPYRLVNGLTVSDSFNQLFSEPLQNPINVDEFSQTRNTAVWTGLTKDGASYPGIDFCSDWTALYGGSGSHGISDRTDAWWVEVPDSIAGQPTEGECIDNFALYCVEQQ